MEIIIHLLVLLCFLYLGYKSYVFFYTEYLLLQIYKKYGSDDLNTCRTLLEMDADYCTIYNKDNLEFVKEFIKIRKENKVGN